MNKLKKLKKDKTHIIVSVPILGKANDSLL